MTFVSGAAIANGTVRGLSHLEVLVAGLLPLLVHGVRRGAGEATEGEEENETDGDTSESVEGNPLALAWGSLGAGTVGTEGNPVSCGG